MVRTDCREQKLDAFYAPKSLTTQVEPSHSSVTGHNSADGERKRAAPAGSDQTPATKKRRHHKPVELTSVRNLQRKVLKGTQRYANSSYESYCQVTQRYGLSFTQI